jgi:hypothetical protein
MRKIGWPWLVASGGVQMIFMALFFTQLTLYPSDGLEALGAAAAGIPSLLAVVVGTSCLAAHQLTATATSKWVAFGSQIIAFLAPASALLGGLPGPYPWLAAGSCIAMAVIPFLWQEPTL